ncbi:helix-turn-helix transcriptional regulator [Botrimarina mediterranea]|uniref:MarR family protein n=1 Tax=Botrimarina mediterranea TaxID=2528022 RepID=A0A518KAT7_9BACT|nr:winged helix-turn-helix transcriptional regulator [Botrimarina mediterranea]QDV74898.1 MarR family protein [Botrimarina mediterranea]QDV79541.1 MarR family protein [Planctomycetes bacterium K2D]
MVTSDDSDRLLLDYLRRHRTASVGELGDLLGVTATAIRQRLTRLMAEGLIERQLRHPAVTNGPQEASEELLEASQGVRRDPTPPRSKNGRGRPSYDYRLTDRGRQSAGDNFHDLAEVLWQEIRQIEEPRVRVGLVKRVAERLAQRYSSQVGGEDVAERMRHLMRLMGEREVPVDVDETNGLPVLTMLACPYPQLAEQDRSICAVEKAMISEIVGQGMRLSECRLDGGGCCTFSPSAEFATEGATE